MRKNLLDAREDLRGWAPPLARIMYQSLSPLNRLTLMGILPSPSLIASLSSSAFPSCCSFSFLCHTGVAAWPSTPTVMPLGRRGGLMFLHSLSVTVSGCFPIKIMTAKQTVVSQVRLTFSFTDRHSIAYSSLITTVCSCTSQSLSPSSQHYPKSLPRPSPQLSCGSEAGVCSPGAAVCVCECASGGGGGHVPG